MAGNVVDRKRRIFRRKARRMGEELMLLMRQVRSRRMNFIQEKVCLTHRCQKETRNEVDSKRQILCFKLPIAIDTRMRIHHLAIPDKGRPFPYSHLRPCVK